MFRFHRDAFKQRPAHAFAETRQIRFQDVDAAGIIFYSRLFELCHDLWARFLAASGCPLPQLIADRSLVLPIRHAEADYFKPMRFGDDIEVALIATHLEESEVTLAFRFARSRDGELCAAAQSIHVSIDPATFMRIPMPEPLRSSLATLRSTWPE